jgi:hypothetical protein
LFVGTVADFSGMDPLIYREPLRTEQYDATNLNGKSIQKSISSSPHHDIFSSPCKMSTLCVSTGIHRNRDRFVSEIYESNCGTSLFPNTGWSHIQRNVSCCFIMAFHDDGSCVKE